MCNQINWWHQKIWNTYFKFLNIRFIILLVLVQYLIKSSTLTRHCVIFEWFINFCLSMFAFNAMKRMTLQLFVIFYMAFSNIICQALSSINKVCFYVWSPIETIKSRFVTYKSITLSTIWKLNRFWFFMFFCSTRQQYWCRNKNFFLTASI